MNQKKFFTSCAIVTVICFGVSCIPLLFSVLEDSSDFSYVNLDVTATVNRDGSMTMHEEFYLDADYDSHTYYREISYKKNASVSYSSDNQAEFDTSSFYVTVETKDGTISASYEDALNPYLGNETDNIIAFEGQKNELGEIIRCEETYSHRVEIYLKNGITGKTKYILDYKIDKVVNVFEDIAEVNWNFIPGLEATKKNVTLTILLPEKSIHWRRTTTIRMT